MSSTVCFLIIYDSASHVPRRPLLCPKPVGSRCYSVHELSAHIRRRATPATALRRLGVTSVPELVLVNLALPRQQSDKARFLPGLLANPPDHLLCTGLNGSRWLRDKTVNKSKWMMHTVGSPDARNLACQVPEAKAAPSQIGTMR